MADENPVFFLKKTILFTGFPTLDKCLNSIVKADAKNAQSRISAEFQYF